MSNMFTKVLGRQKFMMLGICLKTRTVLQSKQISVGRGGGLGNFTYGDVNPIFFGQNIFADIDTFGSRENILRI